MIDDKAKIGRQDRNRAAISQDYEVEDFHQTHDHLTRAEAVLILKEADGDRKRADRLARERLQEI